MATGRRSDFLLAGLGLVAIANGVFLGLAFYGILALGLRLLGEPVPPFGFGLGAGAIAGLGVLSLSMSRARALREGDYGAWSFHEAAPAPLPQRLARLVESSALQRAPAIYVLYSPDPNAFAVGRSREDASIVVTSGLLGSLSLAELDAILAHEIAHIESEDIKAVGFADAVADAIAELGQLKGRFLWGPKRIAIALWPAWALSAALLVAIEVMPHAGPNTPGLSGLLYLLLALGALLAYFAALGTIAGRSLRGAAQLFLYTTFFGPMTAVEMALGPPSVLALSRLISRARIHEADARSVELTGDAGALISALRKVEPVERSPNSVEVGRDLRFALLVAPRAQSGWQAWVERIYATHPSIADRIEALD